MNTALSVGDSVTWTHCTARGNHINFSTRSGEIVSLGNVVAEVQMRNGKRTRVYVKGLRKEGEKTELTEMLHGISNPKGKETN